MKNNIIRMLALGVLLVSSCAFTTSGLPQPLRKEATKAVMVFAANKEGRVTASGFPVSKSLIATAGHFCDDVVRRTVDGQLDGDITVQYMSNGKVKVIKGFRVIRYEFNPGVDVCLIAKPNHGLEPVKLIENYGEVDFGDRVFIVGAPMGLYPIITEGYVSLPRTSNMSVEWLDGKLMLSAPSTFGNSGGPVYDEDGNVIGMAVMTEPNYHHAVFAITIIEIKMMMVGLVE